MKKEIKIACRGSNFIKLENLNIFQGELKSLSKQNYQKLKNQIIELGFSSPIHVWKNKDQFNILDGTQRTNTLRQMQKEGWIIPPLPIVLVEAKNKREAKKKILSLTSQYGQLDSQGLYAFMNESELDIDDLENLTFADLDLDEFKQGYFEVDFQPGGEDEQGQLDRTEEKTVCDKCGQTVKTKIKT